MTPTNTKKNAKRGAITGAALEDADVLASSAQILAQTRGGGMRGLQQFFTPPEVAQLAKAVLRTDKHMTFDPTAGDGALLSATPAAMRFGVEIDADQVDAGEYTAIRGDIQQVYPLLRGASAAFSRVVANPPFGLDDWSDPVLSNGKRVNSMLLTWRYCQRLVARNGAGLMIAGRDRFKKLVEGSKNGDARHLVLTIDVEDLFDGVDLPVIIAFFRGEAAHNEDTDVARFTATREQLADADFQLEVAAAFRKRAVFVHDRDLSLTWRGPSEIAKETGDLFNVVQDEYDKRTADRKLSQDYDVQLAGGKLSVKPSPYARVAISQNNRSDMRSIELLHKQPISYFALNLREWNRLVSLERDGALSIDPLAMTTIEAAIEKGRKQLRPMYPIPTQMRLGFLDDYEQLLCRESSEEQGFVAGEWYPLSITTKVVSEHEERVHTGRGGKTEVRRFEKERKLLAIRVGTHTFDESPENIKLIEKLFELPDPGDLASNHPEEVAEARDTLYAIAAENGIELSDWQAEDLARCVVKERDLLGWSQGGGKTCGQFYFAEACIRLGKAKDVALFIAPQDLHEQWQRELTKFLGSTGRTLEIIQTPGDAARVRRHIREGGTGWYITHYEGLSLIGTAATKRRNITIIEESAGDDGTDDQATALTSEEVCPSCREPRSGAWSGSYCNSCGYTHYEVRVKPLASILSTTFKHGVICVDELSMVRGDTSRRSLALRGLRAACRLGASGTPIANYINDIFWGLGWCIGFDTARFPYAYEDGKAKFEKDFCVIEHMMGSKNEGEDHKRQRRKVLPEITNVSMLWRLLSMNMVRRRQRDMGEMVERTFHSIEVPMGVNQMGANKKWLDGFVGFFESRNPDHPLVEAGVVEKFQAALGLLWKMEYAATLPTADPDSDWHGLDVSDFTPKFVRALEIIEERVAAGDKVLVGSCLIDTGPLISQLLAARGIRAAHITESSGDGKAKTKSPKARAKAVTEFVMGDTDVLCAGVQAMKLGHNLDMASTVVLIGFPWSYEAFDQFLARVWRRTSKKPVNVYCIIAKGTIDERKYKLLSDKAAASDVALDGQLIEEPEETEDWNKILKKMRAAGIRVTGDEVVESTLEEEWRGRARTIKPRALAAARKPLKAPTEPSPAPASGLGGLGRPAWLTDVDPGEQTELAI